MARSSTEVNRSHLPPPASSHHWSHSLSPTPFSLERRKGLQSSASLGEGLRISGDLEHLRFARRLPAAVSPSELTPVHRGRTIAVLVRTRWAEVSSEGQPCACQPRAKRRRESSPEAQRPPVSDAKPRKPLAPFQGERGLGIENETSGD